MKLHYDSVLMYFFQKSMYDGYLLFMKVKISVVLIILFRKSSKYFYCVAKVKWQNQINVSFY